MLNICWSNTKRFLSVLVVFGKSFVFVKMSKLKKKKKKKNNVALFWRFSCGLIQSHTLVANPHRNFSRLIGESMSQLGKILRIFFKIWFFYFFSRLSLATCSRVEVPIARILKDFRGLRRDFLMGKTSSCEKHLQKIFKFFVSKVFSGLPWQFSRLKLVAKNACFAFQG